VVLSVRGEPSGESTPSPLLLKMFVPLVGGDLEGVLAAMASFGLSRTPEQDGCSRPSNVGTNRILSETAKADPPMWGQTVTDTGAGFRVLGERSANACV
jgi:hypothetical protein